MSDNMNQQQQYIPPDPPLQQQQPPPIMANNNPTNTNQLDKNKLVFSLIELLSNSLTEHFWGTVVFLSIIGIFYGIYTGKVSFEGFTIASSMSSFSILTFIGVIIMIGILLVNMNKIAAIVKKNETDRSINKVVVNECKNIKVELKQFSKILYELQSMHKDLNKAINKLVDLISDENVNTQRIRQELNTINSVIHKIPDRSAIINILNIRTKVLFKDVSEIISEYINFNQVNNIKDADEDSVLNKSKISFIEENLKSKFNKVITVFINDIYEYSKNTLDPSMKEYIQNMLHASFNQILDIVLIQSDKYSTEELFFIILKEINKLGNELAVVYSNNLILTSYFEDDDIQHK